MYFDIWVEVRDHQNHAKWADIVAYCKHYGFTTNQTDTAVYYVQEIQDEYRAWVAKQRERTK